MLIAIITAVVGAAATVAILVAAYRLVPPLRAGGPRRDLRQASWTAHEAELVEAITRAEQERRDEIDALRQLMLQQRLELSKLRREGRERRIEEDRARTRARDLELRRRRAGNEARHFSEMPVASLTEEQVVPVLPA